MIIIKNKNKQKYLISLLVIILGIASFHPVFAATNYQASVVKYSPSQNIKLKAGATTTVKIDYRNAGRLAWINSGTNAIKLKTDSSGDDFVTAKWLNATTPTKLYYSKINPGDTIWFEVPVKAPATNGAYAIKIFLMAGTQTITNSSTTINITVSGGKNPVITPTKNSTNNGLTEALKITSDQKTSLPITIDAANYQLKANGQVFDSQKLGNRFQIDFNFSIKRYFVNDQFGQRILMTDQPIDFYPTDPSEQLKLNSNGQYSFCGHLKFFYQDPSSSFSILTDAASSCYPKLISTPTEPSNNTPGNVGQTWWQSIDSNINITDYFKFNQEPIIKVGLLYQTDDDESLLPLKIRTLNNQPYQIRDDNDNLLTLATSGDLLEVDFDFKLKKYFVNSNGVRMSMTDSPLHFVGQSPDTIFEIASWKNGPFWGMNVNDNDYRGNLIVKYNPNTERLWLINEILMEKYLLGNSEIWDTWPVEMLKTQMIAARTYATFRYITPKYTNSPDPDEDPIFTVRATQADQVYRGYQGELRNPNTVKAVQDTRAIVATYNNDPILAYYFAQTDGHTRDSVSAGMTRAPVDYLKSVIDPPGEGLKLKGHGVGLPQVGGKVAAQQGANFSQILKYYYQGIDLKRFYP